VYVASNEVMSKQVGRKALIFLTDGEDEGSRLKLKDAIEAAQKADTICYVLLLSDPQFRSNPGDMRELAEQTGGRLISVNRPEKMGEAFDQIQAQISLTFAGIKPVTGEAGIGEDGPNIPIKQHTRTRPIGAG